MTGKETLILSIDAMGGDNAPRSVIEGVSMVAKSHPGELFFFLFGDEAKHHDTVYRLKIKDDYITFKERLVKFEVAPLKVNRGKHGF